MDRETVLEFLKGRREIRVPLDTIREGLGCDLAALWEALIELGERGDVETWEESACLTPIAAARAGLMYGSGGWSRLGDRPKSTRRKKGTKTTSEADLDRDGETFDDFYDDTQARPDQEAEIREGIAAHPAVRRGDYLTRPLQQPTRFLGATAIWPLPGQRNDDGSRRLPLAEVGAGRGEGNVTLYNGPCSGCGGRRLDAGDYCLACGRSGQDHLIVRPTAAAKPTKAMIRRAKDRKARSA